MPKKITTLPPDLGARLKSLRKFLKLSQIGFAKLVGVSQSVISSAEKGSQPPPVEVYYWLALKKPEVDIRRLLTGETQKTLIDPYKVAANIRPIIRPVGASLDDLPDEVVADEYLAVPLLEGKAAAGPGGVVWNKKTSMVWVCRKELNHRKNLVAIRVAGDSMTPTVPDGSIIIIDRDDWDPRANHAAQRAVWALRTQEGDTQVKRLQRLKDGPYIMVSDNLDYPAESVWTDNLRDLVIGRAVWMWRSLEK